MQNWVPELVWAPSARHFRWSTSRKVAWTRSFSASTADGISGWSSRSQVDGGCDDGSQFDLVVELHGVPQADDRIVRAADRAVGLDEHHRFLRQRQATSFAWSV